MDNEQARQLVEQGGAFLFLDVPQGSYFGLDHQVFIVGEKFKGVKMIPPGPHFVRYHATSAHGDVSPATSFFVLVALRSVLVRRWDTSLEKLCTIADDDEVERLAAGMRRFDFDQFLAPYDLAHYHEWQSLSSHITEDVIKQLSPASGEISSMFEAADEEPHTAAEQQLQQQLDEGHKRGLGAGGPTSSHKPPGAGNVSSSSMDVDTPAGQESGEAGQATRGGDASTSGSCRYSTVPRLMKPSGVSAEQLTALNMDKSPLLERIAQERYQGNYTAILGELQFAFVSFVYGQSLAGFSQWKALLGLVLESEAALLHRSPTFLPAFLRALMAQLRLSIVPPQDEGDAPSLGVALVDELLPDSFLRRLFGNFFQMMHDNHEALQSEAFMEVEKLRRLLRERLGWEFEMETLGGDSDDEYAPVMVEIPEGVVLG